MLNSSLPWPISNQIYPYKLFKIVNPDDDIHETKQYEMSCSIIRFPSFKKSIHTIVENFHCWQSPKFIWKLKISKRNIWLFCLSMTFKIMLASNKYYTLPYSTRFLLIFFLLCNSCLQACEFWQNLLHSQHSPPHPTHPYACFKLTDWRIWMAWKLQWPQEAERVSFYGLDWVGAKLEQLKSISYRAIINIKFCYI